MENNTATTTEVTFNFTEMSEKELMALNLEELKTRADDLAKEYNEANQTERFDIVAKINAEIEKTVTAYTAIATDVTFDTLAAQEDPMLAAVTMLEYLVISAKDERTKEAKIPVRRIIYKEKQIDLVKLQSHIADGNKSKYIGKDANWFHIIEKLNLHLTAQKAVDLGIDPTAINDSFYMSDIAHKIDLGKTPLSKTNTLKTLQTVINAMIGEDYKATSHDVNYIMTVYARKNRAALSVTCANNKRLVGYIAEVCHRIVTGKSYQVVYKEKKQK